MRSVSGWFTFLLTLCCLQTSFADTGLPSQSRLRRYVVSYDTQGQSIWGQGNGQFNEDYSFSLTKGFDLPLLGFEFDPCWPIDCPLGAFVGVHVDATGGLRFHTDASIGTVDVHCPIVVTITYPDPATLHPGETFQIQTSYVIDPSAQLRTHRPDFHARLAGEGSAALKLHVRADAGINLFDTDLIGPYNVSLQQDLFDSDQVLNDHGEGDFTLIPQILTGNIHRPLLDNAVGRTGVHSSLISDKADDFFSVTGDVTNLLTDLLGLGTWNGSYGGSVYGGNFQILDLYGKFDLGADQKCTFQPIPIIKFRTTDGQVVQVPAGQAATLKMPNSAVLTVTPTIRPDNSFLNETKLTLTPSVNFEPLHITGRGHAFGYDIFPFDIHPFGSPLSIRDTIDLPLNGTSFELAGVQDQQEDATTIDATNNPLQLVEITPFQVFVTEKDLILTGKARGYIDHVTFMTINGQRLRPLFPAYNHGNFTVTIPCFYLNSPGILSLNLVTNAQPNMPEKVSNTVELQVRAIDMAPSDVASVTAQQDKQIEKLPTVGNGPVRITIHTARFHAGASDCPPPQFLGGSAALLWNHVPVVTQIQSSQADSANGTDTEYLITATIPEALIVDGGDQLLSLFNPGPGAAVTDIATVTLAFPVPTLREFSIGNAVGGSPKWRLINVFGSLFTPSAVVTMDNMPLPTRFVSSRQLVAEISAEDLAQPGEHPIAVTNPLPSGGQSSVLFHTVPIPIPLNVTAAHNIYRDFTNRSEVWDMLVLTNAGTAPLKKIEIKKIKVTLDSDEDKNGDREDRFNVTVAPDTLSYTGPGDSHALMIHFKASETLTGQPATLKVSCKANGQTFTISEKFTIP